MRILKLSITLLFALIVNNHVYAQNANSQFVDMLDGRFDVSGYLSENAYGFLPVPIIITEPAVDGGLGMVGLFFHETEEEKNKRLKAMQSADKDALRYLMPPSVSAAAAVATGNNSWFAGGGHMGFFNEGRIRYKGGGGYGDVNLDYFGSGEISFDRPIELNTKASVIMQSISFMIENSAFFLGLSQRYIDAEISPVNLGDIDNILPPDTSDEIKNLLTRDIVTSALGLNLEFDTRDNMFSPTEGYQYTVDYLLYRDSFGSDIEYDLTEIKGLNYWRLNNKWRLGVKLESEYANSDSFLPPFATPSIVLRGIPAMRYQGKLVGTVETEVTWQVDSRWSVLGFVGSGKATNVTSDFSDANSHSAKGMGFRYHVARRYGFDMGIDIAKGPEDTVFYITAGSAWGR